MGQRYGAPDWVWHGARALATAGMLFYLVATSAPWGTDHIQVSGGPTFTTTIPSPAGIFVILHDLGLPARPEVSLFLTVLFEMLPLIAIPLALMLWLPVFRTAARVIYLLGFGWLTLASVLSGLGVAGILFWRRISVPAGAPPHPFQTVESVSPTWELWLALGSLLVTWIGLVLAWRLLSTRLLDIQQPGATRVYSRYGIVEALVTGGVALWTAGFLFLPWARTHCSVPVISLNHTAAGVCSTLDGYDALSYAFTDRLPSGIPFGVIGEVLDRPWEIMLVGGVLVVILIWWQPRAKATLACTAIWLAGVSVLTALGIHGVTIIVDVAPVLSYGTSTDWSMGAGVVVALAGIALAAIGVIPLVWRRARPAARLVTAGEA